MEKTPEYGTLYIVATPIGNLEDITFRAIKILNQVDLIAAEDTRHSRKLLSHYDIKAPLVSCHDHNENEKTPQLITRLKNGSDIALISDAGTPCISDPGYTLVYKAAKEQIPIVPVPGCCAAIAGLSVAGLPTDAFIFSGFLPKKKQPLKKILETLKDERPTLIIYESPKRIMKLLETILDLFGDRQACLAREITKLHEEYIRGSLSQILSRLSLRERIKGEIVLFVTGSCGPEIPDDDQIQTIIKNRLTENKLGTSILARQISEKYNLSRKKVYDIILQLKSGD